MEHKYIKPSYMKEGSMAGLSYPKPSHETMPSNNVQVEAEAQLIGLVMLNFVDGGSHSTIRRLRHKETTYQSDVATG